MAINLHVRCKSRLRELIEYYLEHLKIVHGTFIDLNTLSGLENIDNVLDLNKSNLLNKFISDTPASDFILSSIYRKLHDDYTYSLETNEIGLKNLDGFSDLKAVANSFVEDLNSLPWQYHFTYSFGHAMGADLNKHIGNYAVSKDIELFVYEADIESAYPLKSGIDNRDKELFDTHKPGEIRLLGSGILSGLLGLEPIQSRYWNDTACYLRIKLDGYIGKYKATRTISRALFLFKAFIGLCLSHRLFNFDPGVSFNSNTDWFVIHKIDGEKREIIETYQLPDDILYGVTNLHFNIIDEAKEKAETKEFVKKLLEKISLPFQYTGKSENILLASNWYFDSIINKNDLLGFVQAVVVLEILLGDKSVSDILGLGELLRNRCAYLISDNLEERNTLLKKFNEIYKVRSNIVHSGKNELDDEEKKALLYLQGICARVIRKEVDIFGS